MAIEKLKEKAKEILNLKDSNLLKD